MSHDLIRTGTRVAATLAMAAGIALVVHEATHEARAVVLAGGGALIAAGPAFWYLARADLAVLGAAAALCLGIVVLVLGLVYDSPGAGFDIALGLALTGVAVWTLVAHVRGAKE